MDGAETVAAEAKATSKVKRKATLEPEPEAEPELAPEAEAESELSAVKEIFEIFDADRDGLLSKAEYKSYLKGIGSWGGTNNYTEEKFGSDLHLN